MNNYASCQPKYGRKNPQNKGLRVNIKKNDHTLTVTWREEIKQAVAVVIEE